MPQQELNSIIGYVAMQKQATYLPMQKQAKDDYIDYPEDEENLERLYRAKVGPSLGRSYWEYAKPGLLGSLGGAFAGGLLGLGLNGLTGSYRPAVARDIGTMLGMMLGGTAGSIYGVRNAVGNQADAVAQAIANGDIKVDSNGKILTRKRKPE